MLLHVKQQIHVTPCGLQVRKGTFWGFRPKAGMARQTHPTNTPQSPEADPGPEVDPDWPHSHLLPTRRMCRSQQVELRFTPSQLPQPRIHHP